MLAGGSHRETCTLGTYGDVLWHSTGWPLWAWLSRPRLQLVRGRLVRYDMHVVAHKDTVRRSDCLQELLEMFLGRFDGTLTAHIRAIVGGGQDDNEEAASSEVDEVDGCDGLSLPFEHPPPAVPSSATLGAHAA